MKINHYLDRSWFNGLRYTLHIMKIIYIIMEKMITGGLQEKKDHVDQILKCFMTQESQLVQMIANHHVIVVNM